MCIEVPGEHRFLQNGFLLGNSQGSEFNAVAVLDQVGLIKKIAASTKARDRRALDPEEQARRWLYTAASRAKQELRWAPTWWVKATSEVA